MFVESFTASIEFDHVLALYDIEGSIAHATMLQSVGIITNNELGTMVEGLNAIAEDIKQGTMEWSISLEDVHMNIESTLTDRIGEVGKKLHTGRSRNDQVATDIRLYLRDAIDNILHKTRDLQHGILDLATNETETIMARSDPSPDCPADLICPSPDGVVRDGRSRYRTHAGLPKTRKLHAARFRRARRNNLSH